MQPTTELPQTFWAKVEKTDTHWLWTGAHQSRGYGSFAIAGKTYQAHRLAYETAYGPIPDGLTIDHLCRVPSCVNPEHLEAVSLAENNRSGAAAQWANGFCRMGHRIADVGLYETTRRDGRIRRECQECRRAAANRRLNLTEGVSS